MISQGHPFHSSAQGAEQLSCARRHLERQPLGAEYEPQTVSTDFLASMLIEDQL